MGRYKSHRGERERACLLLHQSRLWRCTSLLSFSCLFPLIQSSGETASQKFCLCSYVSCALVVHCILQTFSDVVAISYQFGREQHVSIMAILVLFLCLNEATAK